MTEPKKYTAKEAMHWMIDNLSEPMREVNFDRFYCFSGGEFLFRDTDSDWEALTNFDSLPALVIKSEYQAWQENLERERKINEQMRNTTPEERDAYERKMEDLLNRQIEAPLLDGLLYKTPKPLDPDGAIATIKDVKRLIKWSLSHLTGFDE